MSGLASRSMERQRICVVTETYPPEVNGVALTLARLVEGLRRLGHMVSVVCPHQRAVGVGSLGGIAGREVTRVRGIALPWYPEVRAGLPAGGTLRDLWARQRPDVVYVATEGPLGWSALCAARRLGVPVWSGFHTRFDDYVRHYGGRRLAPAVFRYLRWFHNRTRGTLIADPALRDELVAGGFENVKILGRGVDSEQFDPSRRSAGLRAAWSVKDGDLVALHVGRVAPEKNIPLAIDAYRAMARVQEKIRLVIVGDGPLRSHLQRAHPDVLFCGMQTGGWLAAHYASADVFLFPSETETFGNVTLEAMSSGLAVVAYDYAAAGAHILDGVSGVLAPRGDSVAFVERARALAQWPARLPRLRRAAREHAVTVGWRHVVEAFEGFLTETRSERIPLHPERGERARARHDTLPWTISR
ncbi:MAG TPA: glycosyltransferase family 1 protein [Candidatus Methylomirabilis sp.]|nr:glycosyltransferase family 1 protein [Candidatus Methylomirabilis sp.]